MLVTGNIAGTLGMATAGDGTIGFTWGNPVDACRRFARGQGAGADRAAMRRAELDSVASCLIATVNTAQPMARRSMVPPGSRCSPAPARAIGAGLHGWRMIATAPGGRPRGSTDGSNLAALRAAFDANAMRWR